MLFAQGTAGDLRSLLLMLQGMDTAGKDGVINHVVGLVNPAGISLVSFKKPTAEELAHDFIWRIEKQLPRPGRLGVFNRSQYQRAYSAAIGRCNTDAASRYVIPSDRKWYRNWAIAALLLETLESLDLSYPDASFDPEVEKGRVRDS